MLRFKNRYHTFITASWQKRSWLAYLLWPLSQLVSAWMVLRDCLYHCGLFKRETLPVPVIVVGNIFVGGTGKTPFTLWLIQACQERGFSPGIVSRGYGRTSRTLHIVEPHSRPKEAGDEPLLLAHHSGCPVVVGADRPSAARLLLTHFPKTNLIISDDGLQHCALGRDIDIILFDERGIGNGWLLPAGPLRESANRSADIIVINDPHHATVLPYSQPTFYMTVTPKEVYQLSHPQQRCDLSFFTHHHNIAAAAGIGHPERFFSSLAEQGILCNTYPLPDHFDYASNPFKKIFAEVILITEKDAIKCQDIPEIREDTRIWVVNTHVSVDASIMTIIINKLTS